MIIKQLSIFCENKPGELNKFIKVLASKQIDLLSLTVSETKEYGIIHAIVDKPEAALAALKDAKWSCNLKDVLAVKIPDEPGSMMHILKTLADANINIKYTYAFFMREKGYACTVLRVDDNDRASELLAKEGLN